MKEIQFFDNVRHFIFKYVEIFIDHVTRRFSIDYLEIIIYFVQKTAPLAWLESGNGVRVGWPVQGVLPPLALRYPEEAKDVQSR